MENNIGIQLPKNVIDKELDCKIGRNKYEFLFSAILFLFYKWYIS